MTKAEQLRQRAETDYAANQQVAANYAQMGMAAPEVCSLTVEQLVELYAQQEADEAERRAKRFKSRAGYRTLCSRYGTDAAKRIISREAN